MATRSDAIRSRRGPGDRDAGPSDSWLPWGPTESRTASPHAEAWTALEPASLGRIELGSLHLPDLNKADLDKPTTRPTIDPLTPAFPATGQILTRFRIITELGRGAFARVYLAEQMDLADRPVALKVAPSLGDEPQNLARLQHSHIVPIHSVHDDAATGLRLICMPYVGGANLAEILRTAETRSHGDRQPTHTGKSLIEALDRLGHTSGRFQTAPTHKAVIASPGPNPEPGAWPSVASDAQERVDPRYHSLWRRCLARMPWTEGHPETTDREAAHDDGPGRRFLGSASFTQAAVWIAARLAEALEHAHDRGILHRDLKPSNILVAADGTPMLLDFNLSAQLGSTAGERAHLGGTLPYMAPEHLDAFDPAGSTPPEGVGPAADIYALGLILFEMLAGVLPFEETDDGLDLSMTLSVMIEERRRGAPSLREFEPSASWSLDSVLRMCLEPSLAKRYQKAGDLAEDLRCLLDDRPLKFAPESSLRERAAKWARRHPRASSSTTVGLLAVVLMVGLGSATWVVRERSEAFAAMLHRGDFAREFRDCQLLLHTAIGPDSHRSLGLTRADETLRRYDVTPGGDWLERSDIQKLPYPRRQELLQEISELIQLRARCRVGTLPAPGRAPKPDQAQRIWDAVSWLTEAEHIDPYPSSSLYLDRATYLDALGEPARSKADRDRAAARPPYSARDFELLGTAKLANGDADGAEASLSNAVSIDPKRFWSRFALGLTHFRQRRFEAAAMDFALCSALAPDFAWPHLNRGLALAAAGRRVEALDAYDQALQLSPDFVEARIDRALVELELDQVERAEMDLARAIRLGRTDAATLAAHAEALSRLGRGDEAEALFAKALGQSPSDVSVLIARAFTRLANDPDRARSDLERVLALDPGSSRARFGLALSLRPKKPNAALEQLDAALTVTPGFPEAIQLRALIRGRMGRRDTIEDVDRLEAIPEPHRLYNASCAMSLLYGVTKEEAHGARAVELLRRSIATGFDPSRPMIDPDLAPLHERSDFRHLLVGG